MAAESHGKKYIRLNGVQEVCSALDEEKNGYAARDQLLYAL